MVKTVRNKTLRSGRKTYQIHAPDAQRDDGELVKMRYNSGRHAMDRGEARTWQVWSLNTERTLVDSFEEAAHEFEQRTNETAPKPKWME